MRAQLEDRGSLFIFVGSWCQLGFDLQAIIFSPPAYFLERCGFDNDSYQVRYL